MTETTQAFLNRVCDMHARGDIHAEGKVNLIRARLIESVCNGAPKETTDMLTNEMIDCEREWVLEASRKTATNQR
jgi:hypothetical protein